MALSDFPRSPLHAGMVAGFAGQHRPRRVIGIVASAELDETRDQVARALFRT